MISGFLMEMDGEGAGGITPVNRFWLSQKVQRLMGQVECRVTYTEKKIEVKILGEKGYNKGSNNMKQPAMEE